MWYAKECSCHCCRFFGQNIFWITLFNLLCLEQHPNKESDVLLIQVLLMAWAWEIIPRLVLKCIWPRTVISLGLHKYTFFFALLGSNHEDWPKRDACIIQTVILISKRQHLF